MLDNADDEYLEKLMMCSWVVWNSRNGVVFHNNLPDMQNSLTHINRAISTHFNKESITDNKGKTHSFPNKIQKHNQPQLRWQRPNFLTWSLNVDAAWTENHQTGRLRWVLWNWEGQIIIAGYKFVDHTSSVRTMEAMALLEGLRNLIHWWLTR